MIAEGHPVIVKGRLFRVLCADASGTVTLAPADCKLPPFGSWCSLGTGHEGPCPTRQVPLDTVPATGRITESETVTQAIKVFHTAYMLARARSPRRAGATAAAIAAVVMNVERQLSPQAARTGPKWDAIDAQIKAIAPDDFYVVRASEWDSLQAARVDDADVRLLMTVLSGEHGGDHADDGCDVCSAFTRIEAAISAQPAPCSLNEALAVIEAWADHGNTLAEDDVPRFRAISARIAPSTNNLRQIMEGAAWRAALIGLCVVTREADVATPETAAAHIRARLQRPALVARDDVMRGEACHWRGSMLMVRATTHPERDVGGLSVDAHDSTL